MKSFNRLSFSKMVYLSRFSTTMMATPKSLAPGIADSAYCCHETICHPIFAKAGIVPRWPLPQMYSILSFRTDDAGVVLIGYVDVLHTVASIVCANTIDVAKHVAANINKFFKISTSVSY